MAKRVLSRDLYGGTTTYFDFDESDKGNEIKIKTVADLDMQRGLLSANSDRRGLGEDYYKKGNKQDGEQWHVASIPTSVQLDWYVKYGIRNIAAPEYLPMVKKLINSNEYCYLKTANIVI